MYREAYIYIYLFMSKIIHINTYNLLENHVRISKPSRKLAAQKNTRLRNLPAEGHHLSTLIEDIHDVGSIRDFMFHASVLDELVYPSMTLQTNALLVV